MKKTTLFLIIIFLNSNIIIWGQVPVPVPWHDKAKYYFFKSVETGPWELKPKFYYLIHPRFKKNYKPNKYVRSYLLINGELEKKRYQEQKNEFNEWADREVKLMMDRTTDYMDKNISGVFELTKSLFFENMKNYTELASTSEELNISKLFIEEYERIYQNKKIIGKTKLENSKKSVAYEKVIKEMDELNKLISGQIKIMYNQKVYRDFLK